MHVFPTENFQSRLENDIADPADFHPLVTVHAHGRQSVTSVVVRNRDDTVILFSCGRDGHFVEYELSSQSALAVVQRQRVAKGLDWAERVSISDDGDVLVLGFIKNDMVIINVSSGLMLLKIPCSGGHHAWAFTWRGEMPIFAFFSGHTLHVHGGVGGVYGATNVRGGELICASSTQHKYQDINTRNLSLPTLVSPHPRKASATDCSRPDRVFFRRGHGHAVSVAQLQVQYQWYRQPCKEARNDFK